MPNPPHTLPELLTIGAIMIGLILIARTILASVARDILAVTDRRRMRRE